MQYIHETKLHLYLQIYKKKEKKKKKFDVIKFVWNNHTNIRCIKHLEHFVIHTINDILIIDGEIRQTTNIGIKVNFD